MEEKAVTQSKLKKKENRDKNIKYGKIICLTDNKVFSKVSEAAKYYNIKTSSIYKCITNKMLYTHGLQFTSENGPPPRSRYPKPKKILVHELQGMRFEKLTVLCRAGTTKSKKIKWKCRCDCGKETIAQTAHLLDGRRVSCGCLKLDKSRFRKPAEDIVLKNILRNYKNGAIARNYEFLLTEDEFRNLIFGTCYYCGNTGYGQQTVSYRCNNQQIEITVLHNGIDRQDNNIGYISSNCVSCCELCNRSKMTMKLSDFIDYLDRIVKYRSKL